MKARVTLATLMLASISLTPAVAKTLYVDGQNGNDSVSYASNSQSAPWRTLGRATWGATSPSMASNSEAARAGDLVLISGGPFTAPASGERYIPAFNPVNSGVSGSPIIFRAQGRVELRTTGGAGAVMGSYARDFVHWEGNFYIDEAFAQPHADTGPVVVWDTTGTVIDGCEIQGRPISYVDNHNGVRFEQARNSVLRNCRITGIVGTSNDLMHHNKAGVMLYSSNGILIENNEISNSGSGIFPKGNYNYDITIRYNWIENTRKGIRVSYSDATRGENRIYQNVIRNGTDIEHIGIEVAESSFNWTVANNTIYSVMNGIYLFSGTTGGNIRIANNVIANTTTALNAWESQAVVPGPGRNLYQNSTQWAWSGRAYSSLAAWALAATADASSISASAGFENAGAGNFRLAATSPARGLGVDILDLNLNGSYSDLINSGAYQTGSEVIGRNLGPRPVPPSSVRAE
jgi:hypothetical protein